MTNEREHRLEVVDAQHRPINLTVGPWEELPAGEAWQVDLRCRRWRRIVALPPTELAKVAALILAALQEEGYCQHGVPFDGSYCAGCAGED